MYFDFGTEEEAKIRIIMNDYVNRIKKYCPVIKEPCRDDCICFNPGRIVRPDLNTFRVVPAFCSHVWITGKLSVFVEEG